MAIYNRPRATVDIDLLILSESFDLARPVAPELGYEIRGLDMTFANAAIDIRRVSKTDPASGQVPSLNLLLVTPAIERVWNSRVEAAWEHGMLSVVSLEGLIELKSLRGNAQDLADIAALQEDVNDATN